MKDKILRLDRFLYLAGVGSRREVQKLILSGKVKVNSQRIRSCKFKIFPEKDAVEVNGKRVTLEEPYFVYKFYKPVGYVTSLKDREPTILEVLPRDFPDLKKLFPVGRLDKDAEGLLIFTNWGELAHRILHPRWKLPKTYIVKIDSPLKEEHKAQIEAGTDLGDFKSLPAKVKLLNPEKTFVKITVCEGKYHLLKRLFGKFGYRVLGIKRIKIGPISLGNLKPGEAKKLTEKEIKSLKKALGLLEKGGNSKIKK